MREKLTNYRGFVGGARGSIITELWEDQRRGETPAEVDWLLDKVEVLRSVLNDATADINELLDMVEKDRKEMAGWQRLNKQFIAADKINFEKVTALGVELTARQSEIKHLKAALKAKDNYQEHVDAHLKAEAAQTMVATLSEGDRGRLDEVIHRMKRIYKMLKKIKHPTEDK